MDINLSEFSQILAGYQLSDYAKSLIQELNLVLITSPTSVGGSTIIDQLIRLGNYHFLVSDTTRLPRINNGLLEKNGVDYWFKSPEEVLAGLRKGNYIEAAVIHNQQVSGISTDEIKRAINEHKIAITNIDYQGAERFAILKPDTIFLFILPPSFDEWMKRLKLRGDMTATEVKRRLQSAIKELDSAIHSNIYNFVINDELKSSVDAINQIVIRKFANVRDHSVGMELAKQLMNRLKREIA